MNLKQARYIHTIAQEGGVTAAAKKLYISQPSLSQMLRQIEGGLGVQQLKKEGREQYSIGEYIEKVYNPVMNL